MQYLVKKSTVCGLQSANVRHHWKDKIMLEDARGMPCRILREAASTARNCDSQHP